MSNIRSLSTTAFSRIAHVLNKRVFAMVATLAIIVGVGAVGAKADASYGFGTAYQYFLLNNADATQQAGDSSAPVVGGLLGSGGVSGNFGYDDLVNSAGNSSNQASAKNFSTMMATYSTFGYISTRTQGFDAIIPMLGRFVAGLLFIFSMIDDTLTLVFTPLVNIVAKYNIINLLASGFVQTDFSRSVASALSITPDQIKTVVNATLSFATIGILLTLMKALRNGSANVDRGAMTKLKGRLFTLIALPLVLSASALIINMVATLPVVNEMSANNIFAKYFVDDRNWAYQNNFAPYGSAQNRDGNFNANSGFVDTSLNPYSDKPNGGVDRIRAINSDSPYLQGAFSNSSILASYVIGDKFSARDWLSYKGSPSSRGTIGSYYTYATSHPNRLADITHTYGGSLDTQYSGNQSDSNYGKAIDDENVKNGAVSAPIVAWQDRFIWGSKSGGSKVKDYYSVAPSSEQVTSQVGAGRGDGASDPSSRTYSLSDQTMYLVLSTTFSKTGGTYAISAPAHGILGTAAQFDSSRSDYYSVSMVGNPLYTIFMLLSSTIITVVIFLALVATIIEIGIVEMNMKPLRAFAKGITLGDIEYPEAFLVYSLGIAGTFFIMLVTPQLAVAFITGASNIIIGILSSNSGIGGASTTQTPESSINAYGLTSFGEFLLSGALLIMYWKNPDFRSKLKGIFAFVWEWAVATGERLENSVSRNSRAIKRVREEHEKNGKAKWDDFKRRVGSVNYDDKNKTNGNLDADGTDANNGLDGVKPNQGELLDKNGKPIRKGVIPNRAMTSQEFKDANAKTFANAKGAIDTLTDTATSPSAEVLDNADLAKRAIGDYEKNPTLENKHRALEAIDALQHSIDADDADNTGRYDAISRQDLDDASAKMEKFSEPIAEDVAQDNKATDSQNAKFAQPNVNTSATNNGKFDDLTQNVNQKVNPDKSGVDAQDVNQNVNQQVDRNAVDSDIPNAEQAVDRKIGDNDTSMGSVADETQAIQRKVQDLNASPVQDATQDVNRTVKDADNNPVQDETQAVQRKVQDLNASPVQDETQAVQRKVQDLNASPVQDETQAVQRKVQDLNASPVQDATQAVQRKVQDLNASPVQDATQNVTRRVQDAGNNPVNDATQNVTRRVQDAGNNPVNDATQNVTRRVQDAGNNPVNDATQNVTRRVQDLANKPVQDATQTVKRTVQNAGNSPVNDATQNVTRRVQDLANKPVQDATQTVNRTVQNAGNTAKDTAQNVTQNVTRHIVDDGGADKIGGVTQGVNRRVQGTNNGINSVADATQRVTRNVTEKITPARVTRDLSSALGTSSQQPAVRQAIKAVSDSRSTKELTKAMTALRATMTQNNVTALDDDKLHQALKSKFDSLKSGK